MNRLAPAAGVCAVFALSSPAAMAEHGGRRDTPVGAANVSMSPLQAPAPLAMPRLESPAATAVPLRPLLDAGALDGPPRGHMTAAERRQLREDVSNAGRNLYPPRDR